MHACEQFQIKSEMELSDIVSFAEEAESTSSSTIADTAPSVPVDINLLNTVYNSLEDDSSEWAKLTEHCHKLGFNLIKYRTKNRIKLVILSITAH